MNYKEIIHDLQASNQAKDKELMGILDQIKECSVLFGQADDPVNFSSDEMAMLLPDVALNSDEKCAMISLLHPGSDGGSYVNSDELRSKSESDEASEIHKDYSDSEQGNIMKYQDYIELVNPQKVFKIDYIKKTDGKHEIYQDVNIDPDQVFEVCHDKTKQKLSDETNGNVQYVATLRAYIDSPSESSESDEGEAEFITEVKERQDEISVRWFYGSKVKDYMSKVRDKYRLRMLKRYIAKEREKKMQKNFDCSDLISDTSTNGGKSDLSIRSNTTFSSDDSDKCKDQKGDVDVEKLEESGEDENACKDENDGKKDFEDERSKLCEIETDAPSLGSIWSDGPSHMDISRTLTETITTGRERTMCTDTGYTSKVKKFYKK